METKDKIIAKLESIQDLPSLPTVVNRLMEMVANKEQDIEAISDIIYEDPSIAAKVLQLVNSAFFGARMGNISSIRDAIVRLGFQEIRNLCLSLGVARVFKGRSRSINHKEFWKHSVTTAITTRTIREHSVSKEFEGGEACYTAGLLHDVGMLILDQHFHDLYSKLIGISAETDTPLDVVEMEILGIDHGFIGAILLSRWNLPRIIVETVRHHHFPDNAPDSFQKVTRMVHLADTVARRVLETPESETEADEFSLLSQATLAELEVPAESVGLLLGKVRKQTARSEIFALLI